MTIGAPCVEWEQCTQHTESDEDEWEEDVLDVTRNAVVSCDCGQLKGVVAAVDTIKVVDTQQSKDQQGRASHQHQGQLHGRVLLATRPPYTNQQVHWNQSHLVEHKHSKQVGRDKETIHTCREQGEPQEVLLSKRLQLP